MFCFLCVGLRIQLNYVYLSACTILAFDIFLTLVSLQETELLGTTLPCGAIALVRHNVTIPRLTVLVVLKSVFIFQIVIQYWITAISDRRGTFLHLSHHHPFSWNCSSSFQITKMG